MKNLIFLLMFSSLYSQTGTFKGHVLDRNDHIDFPGVSVEILQGNKTIAKTQTDYYGNFSFNNLNFGAYQLKLAYVVYLPLIQDLNFTTTDTIFEFSYPEPCPESSNVCPINSSDKLIPIVYGLPSKKTFKESKRGKVKLGGCVVTMCDPKWYCKKHKISL